MGISSGASRIVDRLRIESMATIPTLDMLKTLVTELEREAARM